MAQLQGIYNNVKDKIQDIQANELMDLIQGVIHEKHIWRETNRLISYGNSFFLEYMEPRMTSKATAPIRDTTTKNQNPRTPRNNDLTVFMEPPTGDWEIRKMHNELAKNLTEMEQDPISSPQGKNDNILKEGDSMLTEDASNQHYDITSESTHTYNASMSVSGQLALLSQQLAERKQNQDKMDMNIQHLQDQLHSKDQCINKLTEEVQNKQQQIGKLMSELQANQKAIQGIDNLEQ